MSRYFRTTSMRLSEFYNGKTIFLTGATGFVGSLLLEALLRCFPGIVKIYILIRPRKGVEAEDRKKTIFRKRIWRPLLKNNPEVENKVHVLCGDITQPNLGMNKDDMLTVINEATIVFHCGAVIKFLQSARYLALQNSKSTDYVVDLCKKLKKLEVLVYTSTAYSFSNYAPAKIEEIIYRLPYPAQTFLDELEHGTSESFDKLVKRCKPDWINYYTFSKALAENILQDKASDLPIAILRPSVIFSTWKKPIPGYIDKAAGFTQLVEAYTKGVLRVLCYSRDSTSDMFPADIAVNAHIIAGWKVATGRCTSPLVVNLSSFQKYPIFVLSVSELIRGTLMKGNTAPNGQLEPQRIILAEGILFWTYAIYHCFAPSLVFDMFSLLSGKKPRLWKLNMYMLDQLQHFYKFSHTKFEYGDKNFKNLSEELDHEEREMLFMDLENVDLRSLVANLNPSADMFDWSTDKLTATERKQKVLMNTMIYTFVKRLNLLLFCFIIYYIIYKIFF